MNKLIFINKPLINFIKNEVVQKYYSSPTPGRQLQHKLDDIIEGILYICKTGIQIKFTDYKGIPGTAIMYHYYKWVADNIFYKCWIKVYNMYQTRHKYNKNLNYLSVDCTYIKSINGNNCIGRNSTDRGRNGNKLSVITDLIGVPVGYYLAPANISDEKLLDKTLKSKIYKRKSRSNVYADKGYSSNPSIKVVNDNNGRLFAPNKKNFIKPLFINTSKLTKIRYVVEAQFSWLKSYKRIILRYDRLVNNFENFILLAFSMITCRKCATFSLNYKS